MKAKILNNAGNMFLSLGFKSVTMDDIANEIGVSKKTIYTHFKNKTDLIQEVVQSIFEKVSCGIDAICMENKNPIEEMYEIKQFSMDFLKDEKTSPQYQLQKYYPKIYASIREKQFDVMQNCIVRNLEKGVEIGMYRETIDIGFVSRIYFLGVIGIKDVDVFPLKQFSMNNLMNFHLEYHLRGICTEEGIEKMNQIIKINQL